MPLHNSLTRGLNRFIRRGRTRVAKGLVRRAFLPAVLLEGLGNVAVQDLIVGGIDAFAKGVTKPFVGERPKRAPNAIERINFAASQASLSFWAEAVNTVDKVTDLILKKEVSDLIDIPEEIFRDAILGLKRIDEELIKRRFIK